MTSSSMAHLVPLAKQLDDSKVTPGVTGFLVFAVIGLALWFLMKNMNKQFTKVDFEEAPPEDAAARGRSAPAGEADSGDAEDAGSADPGQSPAEDTSETKDGAKT